MFSERQSVRMSKTINDGWQRMLYSCIQYPYMATVDERANKQVASYQVYT